jgi:hypothetical protein
MLDNVLTLPIIAPFLALLHSRKFIVAAITVGVSLLVAKVPELKEWSPLIIAALTALAGVLIHGIAKEDAAKYAVENAMSPDEALAELRNDISEAVHEAVNIALNPPPKQ